MQMHPTGTVITWQDFHTAIREHHIPDGLMEIKKEEFYNPTQGKKMVDQYSNEFTSLAHYAGDEVSTDAKKLARFQKGLNPTLKHDLKKAAYTTTLIGRKSKG